jgi:probable HAF family extracellular repeat protein
VAGPSTSIFSITTIGNQAYGLNASGQVVGLVRNRAFLWTPSVANGTSGSMIILGTFGGNLSLAQDINTSGQVTGYATQSDGSYRAFLYSQGVLTNLGTLGANFSAGYGINDAGQVTGGSYVNSGGTSNEHAFLWTPTIPNGSSGSMADLGTLGGDTSYARAINGFGQVVGEAYDASGNFFAFLYSNGTMQNLGTLGGEWSQAYGINDAGQVVGQAYLPGDVGAHAFLWQNGIMTDLGALGGSYSTAIAISPNGQYIVGYANVLSGADIVYHAFIYTRGRMVDLNSLIPANSGWVLNQANSINNAGQIVGFGTLNGKPRGFLLTPK